MLDEAAVAEILRRAWSDPERGLGLDTPPHAVALADEGAAAIARYASGDARIALNALVVAGYARRRSIDRVDAALIADLLERRALSTTRAARHFNIISALHKSLRNSDPDAALYWLADAGGGRGSDAVARRRGPLRLRRRGARRSTGAAADRRRRPCDAPARDARSQPHWPRPRCTGDGAEEQRRLHRLRQRRRRRPGTWPSRCPRTCATRQPG